MSKEIKCNPLKAFEVKSEVRVDHRAFNLFIFDNFSLALFLHVFRRLDRIRREMSADTVNRSPEPEPTMPSTPPPWTMEPPPSYDAVMKSQERNEQL